MRLLRQLDIVKFVVAQSNTIVMSLLPAITSKDGQIISKPLTYAINLNASIQAISYLNQNVSTRLDGVAKTI